MARQLLVSPILLTIMLLWGCSTVDTLKFSAEASVDAMKASLDSKLKAEPGSEPCGFAPG